MSQYFENDPKLGHKALSVEFAFGGRHYSLESDLGVFSKEGLDDGTRYLLEAIAQAPLGTEILDLGCGIGPIGLILAASDPSRHITCSDVSERALALTEANLARYGLSNRVKTVNSDVYTSINSHFDTIVSNPPIRAGKATTYRIYDGAPSHLSPGGRLIIVIRKQQGAESVTAHLHTLFKEVEVRKAKKGYRVIVAHN